MTLDALLADGQYLKVLLHENSQPVLRAFSDSTIANFGTTEASSTSTKQHVPDFNDAAAVYVGLAALAAFLQANVTGPVLESPRAVDELFQQKEQSPAFRRACLASLDTDGVSVYPYIPHVELFCVARWVFTSRLTGNSLPDDLQLGIESGKSGNDTTDPAEHSLSWLRLRIHTWHYKLLTEPNPGPGSVFNKMTQWSDLPSLQGLINTCLDEGERHVLDGVDARGNPWDRGAKVQFLVEKANIYSMLGLDAKANEALEASSKMSNFEYALSGALGKRTKFQDKSTSQLIVLAKSASGSYQKNDEGTAATAEGTVPQALPLNNDTLLEDVDFSDPANRAGNVKDANAALSPSLKELSPDNQPPLAPLDQIILLTAATLKDAFSPADSLTLEEILPYAARVLSDKATNWQIYSQALIVRSRIELHRSRTVERGVLQMQAVVDQVVVDVDAKATTGGAEDASDNTPTKDTDAADEGEGSIPTIRVTGAAEPDNAQSKPSSFLPAAKNDEQAPPKTRLRYINALSTPPLWHLESELAFAWAGVGSLVSALEIFKRLRLWAEVALCLASNATLGDEDGRGAGGEEQARALLRWQLFSASEGAKEPKEIGGQPDVSSLRPTDFEGPERDPPPANAPRLFCILGDIEQEPKHYERAWELSKHRYSRAQRSLGEHYLQQRDWESARGAYTKAVSANRLNSQLWNRLGDINLRLGNFAGAAEAFGRAIAAASDADGGEDARTWSNLGSALYSMYTEAMKEKRENERRALDGDESGTTVQSSETRVYDELDPTSTADAKRDPAALLSQALAAFKRGASIAHDNWRIWDNVVTLASRAHPPAVKDMVLALHNIISIRNTEDAVDCDVLRVLLNEAVLLKPKPEGGAPTRGSVEKTVCDLIENDIVPLITKRDDLWEVVTRERIWCGDDARAIDAAEKGWRAAVGGASSGSLGSTVSRADDDEAKRNWLENADAWDNVVCRTDELVSILENYGPEVSSIGNRWKMKARSAIRSVMGKGKERWEGTAGWNTLEGLMESLK